tara:strand:+ start:1231 stop:1794 length:564 start_codon:yes stop_codon:yes gene_type:complete
MSKLFVDEIVHQSSQGSGTITIGASGETTNIVGTLQNNGAGVGGTNTPSFFAYLSSNQSFSGATEVKVLNNTESWDTDNAYDNATNYRFTVPTGEGGKYFIIGAAKFSGVPVNEYVRVRFYLNGTADTVGETRLPTTTSGGDEMFKAVHIFDLSAGDYLEMYIRSLSTGGSLLSPGTYFAGYKLIGV